MLTELEFYSLARKLGGSEVEGPVIERPAAKGAFAPPPPRRLTTCPRVRLTARPMPRMPSPPATGSPSTSSPRRSRSRSWTIPRAPRPGRAAPRRAAGGARRQDPAPQPRDADLVGLSLSANPDRGLVSPLWPPRPRGARLARRSVRPSEPVRNLPPLTDAAMAPLRRPADRPGGAEGGAQHQVRLAGAAPRWRRARRRGPTTPCWRASCWIPAAAPTRSTPSASSTSAAR